MYLELLQKRILVRWQEVCCKESFPCSLIHLVNLFLPSHQLIDVLDLLLATQLRESGDVTAVQISKEVIKSRAACEFLLVIYTAHILSWDCILTLREFGLEESPSSFEENLDLTLALIGFLQASESCFLDKDRGTCCSRQGTSGCWVEGGQFSLSFNNCLFHIS